MGEREAGVDWRWGADGRKPLTRQGKEIFAGVGLASSAVQSGRYLL